MEKKQKKNFGNHSMMILRYNYKMYTCYIFYKKLKLYMFCSDEHPKNILDIAMIKIKLLSLKDRTRDILKIKFTNGVFIQHYNSDYYIQIEKSDTKSTI